MTNGSLLRRLRRWAAPYVISTIMVACRNFLITWLVAYVGSSVLNMVNDGQTESFVRQMLFMVLFTAAFLVIPYIFGIFKKLCIVMQAELGFCQQNCGNSSVRFLNLQ